MHSVFKDMLDFASSFTHLAGMKTDALNDVNFVYFSISDIFILR